MGKVKIKRKSTLIDMTAMSDVTVLLLTFFMLTSTFLSKEPATVITPSSVSEVKVKNSNVAQILISPEGGVFVSVLGEADPDLPEENKAAGIYKGSWSSDTIRYELVKQAVADYKKFSGKDPGLTELDYLKFAKLGYFGVPMSQLKEFLNSKQADQDNWGTDKDLNKKHIAGIPLNEIKAHDTDGKEFVTNEFQIWMNAVRKTQNQNLRQAISKDGDGIAIKADGKTEYSVINNVLNNLKEIGMTKMSVMTSLKSENEE